MSILPSSLRAVIWATTTSVAAPLKAADSALPASNPFARESTLAYQYPPFDRIKDTDYAPAFAAGMAAQLQEVEAIASSREQPTFDNTVVALERSGQLLGRVNRTFSNITGTFTNNALRAIEKEMSPKLAAQTDAIRLNAALFARLETVYRRRDQLRLDAESKHLLERYHKDFVRAGAKLSDANKTRLKAINQEIAGLQTTFSQTSRRRATPSPSSSTPARSSPACRKTKSPPRKLPPRRTASPASSSSGC